ncbi:serine hydrolase domain-containing protein, partial [Vibrio mexicanus]|uniref:serine hydrolase domain-containing protein n=1 Tax=Vibrio mexicanus TaxID=1004326 RepID=UPI0006998E37
MKSAIKTTAAVILATLLSGNALAAPSAFGDGFDLQEFYKPYTLSDITPQNMQSWPYYKHVSANWDEYVQTATEQFSAAKKPTPLVQGEQFNLNDALNDEKSYLESLEDTQTKGFVVMKDNQILAEFYDNGFTMNDTNLLQSASKSFAAVVTHKLIDQGLIDANAKVSSILTDFEGTTIGNATVQQVLDMTSGAGTLLDFHTPGTEGYAWEVAIGLKAGKSMSHTQEIKRAEKASEPGTAWDYTDKNTDTLGLIAEKVSGKKFSVLMAELANDFGATSAGSIAVTAEGTASPSYGISLTTRDYALFHQWIAQGKAPQSYYESVMDASKDKITTTNELAAQLMPGVTYGSQTYYIAEDNVLYSSGSFGQIAFSDMETGVVVAMNQDWAVNAEPAKFIESRERAVKIIKALRA